MRIFKIILALGLAGCAGEFNPEIGGSMADTGMESSTGDDGTDTNDSTGSTGMDVGTDDTGTGDTGTGETGIPDGCGDGEAQGMEECDGLDLRGAECTSFAAPENGNFSGGQLVCNDDCTLDFAVCTYCGDGTKNHPSEECDGADMGNNTCEDEGFDGGDLGCDDQCGLVETACENCEGDITGMYGSTEDAQCGGISQGAGNSYWSVCLPNAGCTMDSECADPDLAICANQPVCTDVGGGAAYCKILCDVDEECPAGMVCHDMFANGMFCMWES